MNTDATRPKNNLNSLPEARRRLGGIAHETIYKLIGSGHLKVVKIGRRTFVSDAEIDRFITETEGLAPWV